MMAARYQMTADVESDFEQARVLFGSGRFAEAAAVCRGVLAWQPNHAKALHMLARILTDEGKSADALVLIQQARQLDPSHSSIRSACGRLLLDAGRTRDAIAELQDAMKLDAGNIEASHFLAVAFLRAGELEQAEHTLRAVLAGQPGQAELLDDLGTVLARRGDLAAADACFEDALRQAPEDLGALAQLALWREQNNRVDEALALLAEALARSPQDAFLRFVLGRCQRRQSKYAEALGTLSSLHGSRSPTLEKDIEFELALCADAVGDAEAAYDHARRANRLAAGLAAGTAQGREEFVAQIEHLAARFTRPWVESWTPLPPVPETAPPVFLVGFPRSGTTLLDTMLGAHPGVHVLEEIPTLEAVIDNLNGGFGRYPDALKDLNAEDRRALQRSYYAAAGLGESDYIKRILDKSPLHSVHVGLIRRLFPGAPILFMLRHPCDVVLSCYMTNFEINSSTANFLELGSTVKLYCGVMSLWRKYIEVLEPPYYEVRYEDLVADGEGVLRGVTGFLGLDWIPGMLDHGKHALQRGRIQSASYAQVTRPVYTDACGRWRRYRAYLEPYLDQLRPWCEYFAYVE